MDELSESHISAGELRQRGFKIGAMWHLLGPPHLSLTDAPFPKDKSRHFYRRQDVDDVINCRAYYLWRLSDIMNTAVCRMRQDAVMYPIIQWAETVEITANFPETGLPGVIEMAIKHRIDRLDWNDSIYTKETLPDNIRDHLAYTYLKHQHTNYDQLCDWLHGRPYGQYAYPVVLHRVNALILDKYPTLRVKGDGGTEIRACGACGKLERGIFNGHYWVKPEGWLYRVCNGAGASNEFCSSYCARDYDGLKKSAMRFGRLHGRMDYHRGTIQKELSEYKCKGIEVTQNNKQQVRTFIAIPVHPNVQRYINGYCMAIRERKDVWREGAVQWRWESPKNYHLTLKFLGDVPSDAIPEIQENLRECQTDQTPIDISLGGLGLFHASDESYLWIGVLDGNNHLSALRDSIEQSMYRIGFERGNELFVPHITIARASSQPTDKQYRIIGKSKPHHIGWKSDGAVLYRSERDFRGRGVYYQIGQATS